MQEQYPQKPGIDFILKQAFFYWNKALLFQLMYSIIYFAVFFTSLFVFASEFGIWEQNQIMAKALESGGKEFLDAYTRMLSTENSQKFSLAMMLTVTFLYPLNLGFFQIYRKMDLKEEIGINDMFVGYNGLNFFRYISYFLFWFIVFRFTSITLILALVWVVVTVFVAPLMFFQNKTIFEGISLNFKALKLYFVEIMVCVIVAVLFKYLGFGLFLIGGLFTFPIWNAIIYSLYKTVFPEKV